jgi:predicted RNA-binding protein with RPS1 domain
MRRIDAIQNAVDRVYKTLGVTPNNSRLKLHTQIRSAIGVALSSYCTTNEIGAVLNRERSSCSHYTGKHIQNLQYWTGYAEIYEIVKEEIDENLEDHLIEGKIEAIEARIEKLQETRRKLKLSIKYNQALKEINSEKKNETT